MRLNELAKVMRTVGDENRLKILCVIFHERKICVSDIAQDLNLSVAIVSHHLKVMARDRLLVPRQEGKCTFYHLPDKPLALDLKKFICKYKN
ncbi:MAG: metalloregulator ArsR/SmtB family transcription factor [Candidatus Paceibacterota bacterium]|jgi:DNA-binding transcriptional ArsR family regulator